VTLVKSDKANKQKIKTSFLKKILQKKFYFFAGLISVLNLVLFLAFRFPTELISNFTNLSTLVLVVSPTILVFSYLASFSTNWQLTRSIVIWLQSSFLSFFSLAYIATIENQAFFIFASFALTILIFISNIWLFTSNQKNNFIATSQVVLFAVQVFAFIQFISTDVTAERIINQPIVNYLLEIENIFWLILASISITLLSVYHFNLKTFTANFLAGLTFFVLVYQTFILLNYIQFDGFLYWQKTMVLIIVWNFLFNNLYEVFAEIYSTKYTINTVSSTIYHFLLISLVLITSLM